MMLIPDYLGDIFESAVEAPPIYMEPIPQDTEGAILSLVEIPPSYMVPIPNGD